MIDWDQLAPGWIYSLIFGTKTLVFVVWGLHAMVTAHRRIEPGERWWSSARFWIGATLVTAAAFDAGTFALYFLLGMAVFTWHGVPLYGFGMVISVIGLVAWIRMGRRKAPKPPGTPEG